MRPLGLALIFLFVLGNLSAAQVPSGNVFFGYSFYHGGVPNSSSTFNANGLEASVEGKIIPFLGVVADFDANYAGSVKIPPSDCSGIGCPISPTSTPIPSPGGYLVANISEYNFLFGPRGSVSLGKIRPFAEALIGAAHLVNQGIGSDTSFATAIGGGLDYKLIPHFAWRVQGDYVRSTLFRSTQNNVRISTGIVVRF
jgi:hypothetical protein